MVELGLNIPSLISYLVNYIILLILLGSLAYRPLLNALDNRIEGVRESMASADRAREEAATSRAAVDEELNQARITGQQIVEQARQAADRFREDEMARARQSAEDYAERARADIERERDAAIGELRAAFGDLAIAAAERIIRREIDRQAHQELIDQVLTEGEQAMRRN